MAQTGVNTTLPIGVAGDRATMNPFYSVPSPEGSFKAGVSGVTVGKFAWSDANGIVSNAGSGTPQGFVSRHLNALITTFLANSSMVIPSGFGMELMGAGDFFAKNEGATAATRGMKAYANSSTGAISFAATGNPPTDASVTATVVINSFTGSLAVNTMTASQAGTTLTVSAVGAGTVLGAGLTIAGGGSTVGYVVAGTQILAQLSGTAGGVGTYQVSNSNTVLSTAMTASGAGLTLTGVTTGVLVVGETLTTGGAGTVIARGTGTGGTGTYVVDTAQTVGSTTIVSSGATMNVTAVASGSLHVNDVVSGGTITAGAYVKSFITGTGGTGTYLLTTSAASTSGAVSVLAGVETKWFASSAGGVGELVIISANPTE